GNAEALASGGKLPVEDALHLAEVFGADPSRQVVERAIRVAQSVELDLVPSELRENYRRFLRRNWGSRARELGWAGQPGGADDVRLLRLLIVPAVAGAGGDRELADAARELARKWLADRKSVQPEVAEAVLRTAAYYGDIDLYREFLGELKRTPDSQDRQTLI